MHRLLNVVRLKPLVKCLGNVVMTQIRQWHKTRPVLNFLAHHNLQCARDYFHSTVLKAFQRDHLALEEVRGPLKSGAWRFLVSVGEQDTYDHLEQRSWKMFFTCRIFSQSSPAPLWCHPTSYQLSELRGEICLSVMWRQPQPENHVKSVTSKPSPSNQTHRCNPIIDTWFLVLSGIPRLRFHVVTFIGFRIQVSWIRMKWCMKA